MHPTHPLLAITPVLILMLLAACAQVKTPRTNTPTDPPRRFALALHGGSGIIDRATTPPDKAAAYAASLAGALRLGRDMLERGESALDTVEAVVIMLEDDPRFNAGKGAVFTSAGANELDAAIMDGRTLACGAVACVRTVKNPVRLARAVMEESPHVFLVGDGAESFAAEQGVERVDPAYFRTQERWDALQKALNAAKEHSRAPEPAPDEYKSTVGCVALDSRGNLAAATSTGGMTAKRPGRVGDTPLIGIGTYAANDACAVSCTGNGEEFIRHSVARDVADRVRYKKIPLEAACREIISGVLKPGDGGLIAVSPRGDIAMPFNAPGMFRAAADSTGRFEVAIWDTPMPLPNTPR